MSNIYFIFIFLNPGIYGTMFALCNNHAKFMQGY